MDKRQQQQQPKQPDPQSELAKAKAANNQSAPENKPDPTIEAVAKLQSELEAATERIAALRIKLTEADPDPDAKMRQVAEIMTLQERVKAIPAEVESVKAESVRLILLAAITAAAESVADRLAVTKLYWERATITNNDGTHSTKDSLQINNVASVFGKRKAADGTAQSSRAIVWSCKADGSKLSSTELLAKVKAQAPDVAAMVAGLAKNSADRAIQAIQRKQIPSLAWLADWQRPETK